MKVTVEVDEEILGVANRIAARDKMSIEQVISDFTRRGAHIQPLVAYKNGVPVILKGPGTKTVTLEMVNELRDDEFDLSSRR